MLFNSSSPTWQIIRCKIQISECREVSQIKMLITLAVRGLIAAWTKWNMKCRCRWFVMGLATRSGISINGEYFKNKILKISQKYCDMLTSRTPDLELKTRTNPPRKSKFQFQKFYCRLHKREFGQRYRSEKKFVWIDRVYWLVWFSFSFSRRLHIFSNAESLTSCGSMLSNQGQHPPVDILKKKKRECNACNAI